MRTSLRYFQVDAFTSELFKGNPAGVCVLDGTDWLPTNLMQRIAFENNLSETAFILPQGSTPRAARREPTSPQIAAQTDASQREASYLPFGLRWFTPKVEIDLCGHATLASAFVLFTKYKWREERVEFHSKSGPLMVARKADSILELDFPSRPGERTEAPDDLLTGLRRKPQRVFKARDWMAVYEKADDVLAIKPDFKLLAALPGGKVIVTGPGGGVDFVSRFFAPGVGVDEDPVTGSAHCTLIPYWAERLRKNKLRARQLSERGGELFCEWRGDRVGIGGRAILYSSGHLHV